MEQTMIKQLIDEVVGRIHKELFIEVEASGRHVHLSQEDLETLFGAGYELTPSQELSQPGQFACKERVVLIGSKGVLQNVVVLGPVRKQTQVELSLTDAVALGIPGVIKESGDLDGTPGITIASAKAAVKIDQGAIVAKRHIHINPEDAAKFGVADKELVQVKVHGKRPLIFDDVVIRVSPKYRTYMHIDYDEANACGFKKNETFAQIVKR
ncbi:ethanolamine utilization phosphate acetyltransferase EutD [Brevibacillus ginsengisoli]|uniref:ethanolamine utilization phosphate acetyltransferase EutD n=1 Tax=Brevibacillus ginsengisoli TaxID=363854 RepID=UPI003CF3DBE1